MTWKEKLDDKMVPEFAREIEVFESQMGLRRQGTVDEKVFAETRLRRGVYGQRYDNGQRHDGTETKELNYLSGDLIKGPDTVWDAPGMQRIKIPFGGITPQQLETMADLADEYADAILHITTRQDVQLHFVHIEDTPDLMRRLAAVGITTREACGNSVRNVTACPLAGVCHDEAFDVTPYAKVLSQFLLGHPDVQDFGRKFKPALSGCSQHACGLVNMHDFGLIAKTRVVDGEEKRGFELYVGGGLGAVPHNAKLFDEFVPEEDILPLAQAISRVFARLGEKQNRAKARIKFLVAKLGIDEFKRLVIEEKEQMPLDERWTSWIPEVPDYKEEPLKVAQLLNGKPLPEGFEEWRETNVYMQKQPGYAVATITLPLGDISSWQSRRLADIARKYAGENMRTTVEQNIVFRWVSERDLPDLFEDLKAVGLGDPGAESIMDVVACPGTDTCKLGIASSRGLGGEIRDRLTSKSKEIDEAIKKLRIKLSGCFNSCGQHHVADIGFYGNSRTVDGHKVPHFQVLLGGKWRENAGSYGMTIGSVPSKSVPEVVELITSRFVAERESEETFQDYISRIGKKECRAMLQDLMKVPNYAEDSSFYSDWGDPREFTLGDMGKGECAGEVVELSEFELASAEGLSFEASVCLDDSDYEKADEFAYRSMLQAAKALIKTEWIDITDDPDQIVGEFRTRIYDTELFYDKYAKGKFAGYLFNRYENPPAVHDPDDTHRRVEEAQLFLDAAHACRDRIAEKRSEEGGAFGVAPLDLGG